jgi:hypothetical protein
MSKHQRVDGAEYGGVGADAQGQSEDCDYREDRGFAKGSHGVFQITLEVFEESESPDCVDIFLHEGGVAEGAPGGIARFFGRQTDALLLLGFEIEMRLQFAVKLYLSILTFPERC